MTAVPAPNLLGNLLAYSPLGLSFVDDFTGVAPIGSISPTLSVETTRGSGAWKTTGVSGLFTPSGNLVYPNLGRRAKAPTPPQTVNYQVTITAQYYIPLPAAGGSQAVTFSVTLFDNSTDFSTLTPTTETMTLLPLANYPFSGTSIFLNGVVKGASGAVVVAVVTAVEPFDTQSGDISQTRVMTDQSGNFRLPLRWGYSGLTTTVTAQDPVSGKSGTLNLTYPYDPNVLSKTQTITIPTL